MFCKYKDAFEKSLGDNVPEVLEDYDIAFHDWLLEKGQSERYDRGLPYLDRDDNSCPKCNGHGCNYCLMLDY